MPRRIESLFIDGPAGKLEALLEEPEDQEPRHAVLVCHPHPQFGGTMHNKVVYRIARGLRRAGAVVLRFNYRGVNLSEGKYDKGDRRNGRRPFRVGCSAIPLSRAAVFAGRIFVRLAHHFEARLRNARRCSFGRGRLSLQPSRQPVTGPLWGPEGLYSEQK